MGDKDLYKQQAAEKAVEYVEDGMVIGLGTGSTTQFALEQIGGLIKDGRLKNVVGIPSSIHTAREARRLGIPLTSLQEKPVIDLTIDGADEVDENLNLIKGGGGALLREKIVAQASQRVIIIVDDSKLSPILGTKHRLPVEVLPFAWVPEMNYLKSLKAHVLLRTHADGSTFETDQYNFILDCQFREIKEVKALAQRLDKRAGIMSHGLFVGLASDVICAGEKRIQHFKR
ncbi:MAG: ribose-5-phosphate isomerase RpiA [Calditrichia bacterium]